MSMPLISVLMPVYNGQRWLVQSVTSILNQTAQDVELLIINDGSTDNTAALVYDRWVKFPPPGAVVRFFSLAQHHGLAWALNFGLDYCHGAYIARMDADDVSLPHRFERQLDYLQQHPDIDGVGCFFQYIDEYDCFIGDPMTHFPTHPDEVRAKLGEFTTVPHPTYLMRCEVYDAHKYSLDFPHAEDLEWLMRASRDFRLSNVPEVLLYLRQGPHQVSIQYADLQRQSVEKAKQTWDY